MFILVFLWSIISRITLFLFALRTFFLFYILLVVFSSLRKQKHFSVWSWIEWIHSFSFSSFIRILFSVFLSHFYCIKLSSRNIYKLIYDNNNECLWRRKKNRQNVCNEILIWRWFITRLFRMKKLNIWRYHSSRFYHQINLHESSL